MEEKDWEEISYLIVGGLAMVALLKVWSTKIKPWLAGVLPALREEGKVAVGPLEVASSDLIAGAVIGVVLLVVVATLRSSAKARRRAKKRELST